MFADISWMKKKLISPKHTSELKIVCFLLGDSSHAITADVGITETAEAAQFFGSDGVIVTGSATGKAASQQEIRGKSCLQI